MLITGEFVKNDSDKWSELSAKFDTNSGKVNASAADNVVIAWPVMTSMIRKYLTASEPRVLDFGCGAGGFCKLLHEQGFSLTGIDFSEKMIEVAKSNSPSGISYLTGNEKTLAAFKERFDSVVSIMVLQFVDDSQAFAKAFSSSIKEGGILVIATINPEFVKLCVKNKVRYHDFDEKTGKTVMTFNEGISFNIFVREKEEYAKVFAKAGFVLLEAETPSFPTDFGEKYGWKLPTQVPEFLIMAFKKIR